MVWKISLSSFLLSVLAGIIANYVSKRLDEREKGNKPEP